MRPLDALRGAVTRAASPIAFIGNLVSRQKPGTLAFAEYVATNPYFIPPNADSLTLLKLYNENLWVRAILHKISHNVGQKRWFIEDETDETEIDDHPALDFLRAGSRKLRGKRALALTNTYLDLTGEAFWIIGRDTSGLPVEYVPIPPHWVLDLPNAMQPNFRVQPRMGVVYDIEPNQVVHFREVNPIDPYGRGVGNTHAAILELDTDHSAATFLNKFFQNNARPDFIVSGTKEAPMSERDVARAKQAWANDYGGPKKSGRGFWSSAPLTVQQVSNGLRDNQMKDIREQQRSLISEFWGIPPEIMGRLDSSNRATIDSADYLFSKHVIRPRLELLHDHIEPFLAEEFGLEDGALCYENPIDEDVQKTLEVINVRPAAFSDDEIRELAGYQALGGKHADVFDPVDPSTIPPLGIPPVGGGDPNKPTKDENAPKETDTGAKSLGGPAVLSAADVSPAVEAVQAAPVLVSAAPETATKSLSPDQIVAVSNALSDPIVTAQAAKLFQDLFERLLKGYGQELIDELGRDVRFNVNADVFDWLSSRGSDLVDEIDSTTSAALKAALVDGAAIDEGLDALIARVDDVFKQAADYRAPMIGDTEATALSGYGTLAATKQAGFEETQWVTNHDQKVRKSHADLDGKVRRVGDYYETENGKAQYPGGFGEPSEDINCRCGIRPVLPGEAVSDAERKALGKAPFARWHEDQRSAMMRAVGKKAATIFSAQREVVVAQLKRSMGQHVV